MKRLFIYLNRIAIFCLIFVSSSGHTAQAVLTSEQTGLMGRSQTNLEKHSLNTTAPTQSQVTYFPIILQPEVFHQNPSIWAHTTTPSKHEVALFRYTFSIEDNLENTKLQVFADTRYEVWVDGHWIGRGPARFSRSLREYDVYDLGSLDTGPHLIAALVQWAPNTRRSESTTPFLQAHIRGNYSSGEHISQGTNSQWKTMLSDAWRTDAVPVHSWDLIGPTELLELSRLPRDWNQPGFVDEHWAPAAVLDTSTLNYRPLSVQFQDHSGTDPQITNYTSLTQNATASNTEPKYQPRSIHSLVNEPASFTVLDGGWISPGYLIGELGPSHSGSHTLNFNASSPTELAIEILKETYYSQAYPLLDGNPLTWLESGQHRPDIYEATANIDAGAHQLTFVDIPPEGTTFSVSKTNLEFDNFPFQQGIHAGRRLLLGNPESNLDLLDIAPAEDLNITFNTLPVFVVLDLGRVVHGRLTAETTGPSGTVIDIGWDERLLKGTNRPLPYPGSLHTQWNQVDSWILDGHLRTISTLDARAGRYIQIAVWGNNPIQLRNIQVHEERYPLTPTGTFQSSDPLLNQIWQIGVDSAYANMTDAYTDTPWRERAQWWGDAYVEDHVNRVAFGDTTLLRRGILYMANAFADGRIPGAAPSPNGTNMLDYGMLWVHSLEEYVQQTNDFTFFRQVHPELLQVMELLESYENPGTGLLDLPIGPWTQTAYIGTYAYPSRYGQSAALNAIYFSTLLRAADLVDQTGDSRTAQTWRDKANAIRQMVNNLLYQPADHRYWTNLYQDSSYDPTPQAQAWALAYGLVPDGDVDQVVSSLMTLLSPDPTSPNLSIYGMFWVLEALGRTDHIPEAINIIRNYYGHLINLDATSWWERFDAIDDYTATLSHGWGGSPTWFLTSYVLGAKRLGDNTWVVKPSFTGVTYASGQIPLKDSVVQIYWEVQNNQDKVLKVVSGENTNGKIVLPPPDSTTLITHNGETIWENGQAKTANVYLSSSQVHIIVPSGEHAILIQSGN